MLQRTAARGLAQFRGLLRARWFSVRDSVFAAYPLGRVRAKITLEEMGETRDRIFTPLGHSGYAPCTDPRATITLAAPQSRG